MRAFAELVMRGRREATLICLACAILPLVHWFGSAVVGLVALRKGPLEGGLLVMWASLPLIAWYGMGQDASPLLVLFGTFALALVLRTTMSWELTLAATVVVSGLIGLLFELLSGDALSMLVEWYVEIMNSGAGDPIDAGEARQWLVGFFAMGQAFAIVLALLLARWWQSLLYNPGGFKKEFQGLRLSPRLSLGLMAVIAICFAIGDSMFARWIPLLTVPMALASIALVHWIVNEKKMSGSWLVTFYLALFLLFQLVYPILASLALMDSWMNLRQRMKSDEPDEEV